jgi:protein CWC15
MTTAHRPTYNPAKGGNIQGGNKLYFPSKQYSSKDLPGNLTLKKRHMGQGTKLENNKLDFKKELLEREKKAKFNKNISKVNEIYETNDYNLELEDGGNNIT